MTKREQGKRAFLDQLPKGTSLLTQVNVSKAYDAGYTDGQEAMKDEAYTNGFHDANMYGSKVMIACSCLALHEAFGFGYERMQRFANAFRAKLLDVLDGADAIAEVDERFGVTLTDEVFEDDEE